MTLVLDDFHRLTRKVTEEFSDLLKIFILAKAKIVMVGVKNTSDILVNAYPDLQDRMDGMEVKPLSIKELLEIIKRGERALNIKISDEISEGIIEESFGSASLVHELCLTILEELGQEERSKTKVLIDNIELLKRACRRVAIRRSSAYDVVYNALIRGKRKPKKFVTYNMIMESLSNLRDKEMIIHIDDLLKLIKDKYKDNMPPNHLFTQALLNFKDIQTKFKEVISYNSSSEEMEIIDPGFKFYLKWLKKGKKKV